MVGADVFVVYVVDQKHRTSDVADGLVSALVFGPSGSRWIVFACVGPVEETVEYTRGAHSECDGRCNVDCDEDRM